MIRAAWPLLPVSAETRNVRTCSPDDILALELGGDWKLVGKLPMPLSSPAAAIIEDKFYVAGGSPNGRSVQVKMWVRKAP